jgi:tetratricopeptide (TPR) repeat protein
MKLRYSIVCIIVMLLIPGIANAAETDTQLPSALGLYSKSVDLANAGNFTEALQVSDRALALNDSSFMPLIQANRAGILLSLGRYNEAIIAADAALASEGNRTTTHSIAWYNKGGALRQLGRTDEAKTAYAQALALDPSLLPPRDMTVPVIPVATTAKSPLPPSLAAGALALVFIIGSCCSRTRR